MEPSGNAAFDEAPNRRLRAKYSGAEATGFIDLISSSASLICLCANVGMNIGKRLNLVSIPFGAIVHEAIRVGSAGDREMLLVRLSRRAHDGSYTDEEIETIRDVQACKMVSAFLEWGKGDVWGSWFGLQEPAWLTPSLLSKSDKKSTATLAGRSNRPFAKTI
jgi:hypothetical protein